MKVSTPFNSQRDLMKIKYGCYRIVFLIGNYAIKFPRCTCFKFFVKGLRCNKKETKISKTKCYGICKVLFSFPFGICNIMPRAIFSRIDSFSNFYNEWKLSCITEVKVEKKMDSFGLLNGEIVAIDYGD